MPTGHKSNRQATAQRRRSRRHRRNNWIILPKATSESPQSPQDLSDHETAPPSPSTSATDELADILEASLIVASWDAANEDALVSTALPPPSQPSIRSHHDMSALLLPDLTPCDENESGMIVAPDASLEMGIADKQFDLQEPIPMEVANTGALTPRDE
jgi:hypothetical protein